jgi:hypothetical protein
MERRFQRNPRSKSNRANWAGDACVVNDVLGIAMPEGNLGSGAGRSRGWDPELICQEWPNIQCIMASLEQKDVTQANATRWPGRCSFTVEAKSVLGAHQTSAPGVPRAWRQTKRVQTLRYEGQSSDPGSGANLGRSNPGYLFRRAARQTK